MHCIDHLYPIVLSTTRVAEFLDPLQDFPITYAPAQLGSVFDSARVLKHLLYAKEINKIKPIK